MLTNHINAIYLFHTFSANEQQKQKQTLNLLLAANNLFKNIASHCTN